MQLDDKPDAIKVLIYHCLENHFSKTEIQKIQKLYILFKKFGETVSDDNLNMKNHFPTERTFTTYINNL